MTECPVPTETPAPPNFVRFDSLQPMQQHWRQSLYRRVFWQDQAEWYIICNSCYSVKAREQWSGSTRVSDWLAQKNRVLELAESTEVKRCMFCHNPLFPFVEITFQYYAGDLAELAPLIRQLLKTGYQVFLEELPPKFDWERHISAGGCYQGLLVVTPEFRRLMNQHGKLCRLCKKPFIPQPYWSQYCSATHYPSKHVCGFCVYDMDSRWHSQLLTDEEYQDSF